jgi:hypothetical protein
MIHSRTTACQCSRARIAHYSGVGADRLPPRTMKWAETLCSRIRGRHQMRQLASIIIVPAIVLAVSIPAKADVYVRGYYRSNGTYVQPHWRSSPDGNFSNNWSAYPNVNPYTGAQGTMRTPGHSGSSSYRAPSYGWNSPNMWNGRSPSSPRFSPSTHGTLSDSP